MASRILLYLQAMLQWIIFGLTPAWTLEHLLEDCLIPDPALSTKHPLLSKDYRLKFSSTSWVCCLHLLRHRSHFVARRFYKSSASSTWKTSDTCPRRSVATASRMEVIVRTCSWN